MGDGWDTVGSYRLSASGCSLTLEIEDRLEKIFIGLKELEKVLRKNKKSGTIYILRERYYGDIAREKPVYVEVNE